MTEPAVGASTWASGSQVCTGHIGIFTANEAKKARNSQNWASLGKSVRLNTPMSAEPAKFTIHSMATSMSTEPSSV